MTAGLPLRRSTRDARRRLTTAVARLTAAPAPVADGPLMARSYGALYGSGATLCLLWLLLDDGIGVNVTGVLVCIGIAYVVSVASFTWLPRHATPARMEVLVAIASALVTAVVVFSGSSASPLAWFYLWATGYGFWFFDLTRAARDVVLAAAAYACALLFIGDVAHSELAARWVMTVGSLLVVGVLVRTLVLRLGASTERFLLGFERAGIGMALLDGDGRVLVANAALRMLVGLDATSLAGISIDELTHPDEAETMTVCREQALRIGGGFELEVRLVRPDGSARFAVVSMTTMSAATRDHPTTLAGAPGSDDHGAGAALFAQVTDSDDRRAAHDRMRARTRQQAAVAQLGRFALAGHGSRELVAETLRLVRSALPADRVEAAGFDLPGLGARFGPDDPAPADTDELVAAALAADGGVSCVDRAAAVVVPGDGRALGAIVACSGAGGDFDGDHAAFLTAIATVLGAAVERHRADQRNRHDALHDALTGLPNRSVLEDRVEQAFTRAIPEATLTVLFYLDLDGFKEVNDTHGHHRGDELLRELAPRLVRAVRPSDTVARVGGDEFVLICEALPDELAAEQLEARLEATIAEPFAAGGASVSVRASIGRAAAYGGSGTPQSLIRAADEAMYEVKQRQRLASAANAA